MRIRNPHREAYYENGGRIISSRSADRSRPAATAPLSSNARSASPRPLAPHSKTQPSHVPEPSALDSTHHVGPGELSSESSLGLSDQPLTYPAFSFLKRLTTRFFFKPLSRVAYWSAKFAVAYLVFHLLASSLSLLRVTDRYLVQLFAYVEDRAEQLGEERYRVRSALADRQVCVKTDLF